MTATNGQATTRGVVDIELGGRVFGLTPSWQALDEIETQLGQGIGILLQKALAGAHFLGFNEQAVIIAAGIRATGRAEGSDDRQAGAAAVKEMLFATGTYARSIEVRTFILAAVNGGKLTEAGPGKEPADGATADSRSADI